MKHTARFYNLPSKFVPAVLCALQLLLLFIAVIIAGSCAQENIISENDGRIAIDSISPSRGTVGTQVRIYGKGFSSDPAQNIVTVNGLIANVLDPAGLSTLLIEIPAGAQTGNVNLKVNNVQVSGPQFTMIEAPVFREMKPTSGYEGTVVTFTGTGLTQIKAVLFNGVAAAIAVNEDAYLEVKAPASTTGSITLDYGYGKITTPVFTYLPVPIIRTVIDGGKGLELSAAYINPVRTALSVTYNGIPASILALYEISGNTAKILPDFPAASINNPFDIVITSNGIKSLPYSYTITPVVENITYVAVSSTQETITYDISLYGKYFGTPTTTSKATITFLSRLPAEVPSVVQSWTPTKIVTRVTVNSFWSIGGSGAYRDYFGSVTVNGVVSNNLKFK